jgi:hypothetical protein
MQTQLNANADEIEQNIAKEEATAEYQNLAGQEKYEANREKNEAKKMVTDSRNQAKALDSEIENHESTAKLRETSRPPNDCEDFRSEMKNVPPRFLQPQLSRSMFRKPHSKEVEQCPICYVPKEQEECARCGHVERSHSQYLHACLWTDCECRKFKRFT